VSEITRGRRRANNRGRPGQSVARKGAGASFSAEGRKEEMVPDTLLGPQARFWNRKETSLANDLLLFIVYSMRRLKEVVLRNERNLAR
jgi:hypothetical protein